MIEDQVRHIYEKAELQGVPNVDTNKQEIEQEKLSRDNIDINLNNETTMHRVEKENVSISKEIP